MGIIEQRLMACQLTDVAFGSSSMKSKVGVYVVKVSGRSDGWRWRRTVSDDVVLCFYTLLVLPSCEWRDRRHPYQTLSRTAARMMKVEEWLDGLGTDPRYRNGLVMYGANPPSKLMINPRTFLHY